MSTCTELVPIETLDSPHGALGLGRPLALGCMVPVETLHSPHGCSAECDRSRTKVVGVNGDHTVGSIGADRKVYSR